MSHEAFLQDILEHPDDDTPRLVYADWLDDHGDPERAEFIRVQCQIARLSPDDDRLSGLVARECRIYAAHSRHWHSFTYPKFRRGFVEEATLTTDELRIGLDPLFAAHPLRSLWISGSGLEDAGRL